MPFEFKLPDLGEGIREAQVLAWKVSPGQAVSAFQPLCEVESAKAAVELTAPVAGKVVETRFAEGDVAQLGDVLVVIDTDGKGDDAYFGIVGAPPSHPSQPAPASQPAPSAHAAPTAHAAPREPARVRAAPIVRRMARERGIDLSNVTGSGPQGRVRIADLDASTPATSATPEGSTMAASAPTPAGSIPLRGLRKSIADHMLKAWRHAPQVTSMDLFEVTELVRARELLVPSAEGVKLTYLPFFVKAAVEALKGVPEANATVDEQQQAIVLRRDYNIGIATAVPGGLVVPVVKNADQLSLLEIASEIDRVVNAAREHRGSPADQTGSTFTITSFGALPGSALFATPILNYPEVAILGLGRIDLQPRVVNGAVVPRQCIGVSFTFDHRVLDGEAAGRFMAIFRRFVEQPLELLLRLR